MKKFPLKRMLAVSGLCFAMLLPTGVSAYQGVITEENIKYGQNGAFYQKEQKEKIAKAVEHIKLSKLTKSGWVDIHVTKVKLGSEGIMLKTLRSDTWKRKEKLKEMADKSLQPVFAAVNGSYFATAGSFSESQGFEYDNQLVHVDTLLRAGMFEDKNGNVFFGHVQKLMLIDADSNTELAIPIKSINNFPGNEGASLYNSLIHTDSTEIDKNGSYYKVKVRDGRITEIVPPGSKTSLADSDYSIVFASAMSSYLQSLTTGKRIQLKSDTQIDIDHLKLAIPGGGYVLRNGEYSTEGEVVQPNQRHPRTAIGINRSDNTLIMMVVDGRGESIGATHAELAQYLKEFGVSDAIAMDGGGSSVMLARNLGDAYVNIENALPSNHQRNLINGLAVVSTQTPGQAERLIISAKQNKAFPFMPIALEVRAVDKNDLPVAVNPSQVYWRVVGTDGTVTGNQFIGTKQGIAEVTAYLDGNVSGKIKLEVAGAPIDLKAEPQILEAEPGAYSNFRLWGTDEKGFVGEIAYQNAKYQLEDETVGYFNEGVFVPSKKGGNSRVTITVGNRSATAYIAAGKAVQQMPQFLEQSYSYETFSDAEGAVRTENNFGYDDLKSLVFSYNFKTKEFPEAMLYEKIKMRYHEPVVLENNPQKLSLQLYGDKSAVRMTVDIKDSHGQETEVPLVEGELWQDWKKLEVALPENIVYPVQVLGFGLENMSIIAQSGQIYLDDFQVLGKMKLKAEVYHDLPNDDLRKGFPRAADISVFGATAGRNRLLDDVVLRKVVEKQKQSSVALYAGASDLKAGTLRAGDRKWTNSYEVYDLKETRVFHLAALNGSFKNADASQYEKLAKDLSNTLVDNIIIVSDVHLLEEKKNRREAQAMHEIISRYALSSGKSIYYIAANGYQTDVAIKDGIRYIKTNGLWYKVNGKREINLNQKFYRVNFYLQNKKLYYDIENVYPLVE